MRLFIFSLASLKEPFSTSPQMFQTIQPPVKSGFYTLSNLSRRLISNNLDQFYSKELGQLFTRTWNIDYAPDSLFWLSFSTLFLTLPRFDKYQISANETVIYRISINIRLWFYFCPDLSPKNCKFHPEGGIVAPQAIYRWKAKFSKNFLGQ